MNHSKAFWAQIEAILPEYKTYRKWLRTNAVKLQL
jgi:predicted metal-dependent hydrolase